MKTLWRRGLGVGALLVASGVVLAADFHCLEQCLAAGRTREYCLRLCDTGVGSGLENQAGVPENPAFRQIRPMPEAQPPLPPAYDVKCLEDCRRRGHAYGWCRKQCRY